LQALEARTTPPSSGGASNGPTRPSSAASTRSTASFRGLGGTPGGRGLPQPKIEEKMGGPPSATSVRGVLSGRGRGGASANGSSLITATKPTPTNKTGPAAGKDRRLPIMANIVKIPALSLFLGITTGGRLFRNKKPNPERLVRIQGQNILLLTAAQVYSRTWLGGRKKRTVGKSCLECNLSYPS
jgi:hypothetical protein